MAEQQRKPTQEEINEGLALLAKKRERDEKIKRGEIKGYSYKKMSELSPEQQAKRKAQTKRLTIKNQLLLKKAKEKGITVTDAEIDAEIKKEAAAATAAKK